MKKTSMMKLNAHRELTNMISVIPIKGKHASFFQWHNEWLCLMLHAKVNSWWIIYDIRLLFLLIGVPFSPQSPPP
jgi:hypothetical protein